MYINSGNISKHMVLFSKLTIISQHIIQAKLHFEINFQVIQTNKPILMIHRNYGFFLIPPYMLILVNLPFSNMFYTIGIASFMNGSLFGSSQDTSNHLSCSSFNLISIVSTY